MLHLYMADEIDRLPNGVEIVVDVEAEFRKIRLTGSTVESIILREIDNAEYKNSLQFIDRFGQLLPTKFLSTGCKAALVVLHQTNKIIDLKECGFNARDAIVGTITNGNIIMKFPLRTFGWDPKKEDIDIDVEIDGYKFISLDRLNYYFTDERPYKPDMLRSGIQEVGDINV